MRLIEIIYKCIGVLLRDSKAIGSETGSTETESSCDGTLANESAVWRLEHEANATSQPN